MEYSSLIEFVSFDEMKKAIGRYLEADTEEEAEEATAKSNEKTQSTIVDSETAHGKAEGPVVEDDDDELDDILSEFETTT
jgi:CBS domain-containing protein